MKEKISGILVVEGKTDVAFLSQFIDVEFVITNGSEIPDKTIEYLQKSSENRDIFVLTDPDSPGKRIRDILDQKIPGLKHCFIRKSEAIKKGKVGVAESNIEEVMTALHNFLETKNDKVGTVSHSDLVKLGLEGEVSASEKREIVINKFHLGYCNAKTFLKRVNYANLSYNDLKNCL